MPLALRWDNETCSAKMVRTADGALAEDESLETVVLVSLFTDRPATAEEMAAARLPVQQGWWAHADTVRGTDRVYGSKLWLLQRGVTTQATLRRAEQYCLEALAWLVDMNISRQNEVLATRPRSGEMYLDIKIHRPKTLLPSFERLWKVKTHALV